MKMENNTERYIGTKIINAEPMNRLDYNMFRGWSLPEDENGLDEGYLVEYIDGGVANHIDYKGDISWSPADVFEKSYVKTDGMTFGQAIEAMRIGEKVCRHGWNGKEMYIVLAEEGSFYKIHQDTEAEVGTEPFIVMFTADKKFQPGWLASQSDILSIDWEIAS